MDEADDKPRVDLPPGTYLIDDAGAAAKVPNWQPAIERFKWERLDELINAFSTRGQQERKLNIIGMYVLVGLTLALVGALAWHRVLDGQATAGFLGAAVGYLLSRAQVRGQ